MVIDFHTHAFPDTLAERAIGGLVAGMDPTSTFVPHTNGTLSGLLTHMDRCGVDKSVLLPVITKQKQTVTLNEWAAAAASERVISFGGVFPHTDDFKRDIDYVVSLGLRGLKLHCEYQNFVVDEPQMLRMYDYALSRGLILVFHAGHDPAYQPPYRSSAKQFRTIVDAMRGGVIVAAHLGGHGTWNETERYLVGSDIYLDTSTGFEYFPQEQFLRIARNHGTDKLLFATDSPWTNAEVELRILRSLPLSDAEKAQILGGNAQRLLNLQ